MPTVDQQSLIAQTSGNGIELGDCLINGVCKFDAYELLQIRNSNPEPSPSIFLQDITLGATTFIGTVLVVSFIVSAIMTIMGGAQGNESMASNGKKGIGYSVIGFLLVIFSYTIIRVIQFIAKG